MGSSSVSAAPAPVVKYTTRHVTRGTTPASGYLRAAGDVPSTDSVYVAGPVPELQSGSAPARPQRIESSGIAVTSAAGAHSIPHTV